MLGFRGIRRGARALVLVIGTVLAVVGLAAPLAHAITLPDFPSEPSRFEFPTGSTASAFIPLPGMCADTGDVHGVFQGRHGKPVHNSSLHIVSHSAFKNLCTPEAGMEVAVKFENGEYTGVVTITLTIEGKDEAGATAGPIGPHTIEFYMGVPNPYAVPDPLPAMGGEAGWLALAALAVVMTGTALATVARRRPLA